MNATPENTAVCTIMFYPEGAIIPVSVQWMYESAKKAGCEIQEFRKLQSVAYVPHESFNMKVMEFHEFTKALPDKFEYILYVDARDVLFVQPMAAVCRKFNRIGWPIVISGSNLCFPHVDPGWSERFKRFESGYNFINAGMWMAERSAWDDAYERLIESSELVRHNKVPSSSPELYVNDQHCWQTTYLRDAVPIRIDHEQELFNSFHKTEFDLFDFEKCTPETPIVFKNGSKPAVIHFAGKWTTAMPYVAAYCRIISLNQNVT